MDEFEAITADLWSEERAEHEEHARELLAAADAETRFADWIRRLPRGEVVTVTTLDGDRLRGRIQRVGRDWVRLAEVSDESVPSGSGIRRVHAVRLAAIVRVSRESGR